MGSGAHRGGPVHIGLGDLVLRDKERMQPRAGRLDLLLQDLETKHRYEVELQLDATDEVHIIKNDRGLLPRAASEPDNTPLPGTVFTPRQVRVLKIAVIVMGLLLVGGFGNRGSKPLRGATGN